MPRNIFGPEMGEVNWEWRRRHKEKLYDLNYSQNIIRVTKLRIMRWTDRVARMGEERYIHWGKRQLERIGRIWDDNIKMYLQIV